MGESFARLERGAACHLSLPRPFIRPSQVPRAMLQESETDRRGNETDRTHGIEFTLAGRYSHQYNSHRHLIQMYTVSTLVAADYFGLSSITNTLPLTIPRRFLRRDMIDLNYNTACGLNNCHPRPQGTESICLFFGE